MYDKKGEKYICHYMCVCVCVLFSNNKFILYQRICFHVYSFFMVSCFSIVYLFSIALFEGEFLPPFYILYYSLYVLSSSKGEDYWPKGYTLRFMRFDDNKTYKAIWY